MPWHALPAGEASARLSAGAGGQTEAEAHRRLATHGLNRLPARRVRGPLARFLAQFNNLLIIILLAAAVWRRS